MKVGEKAPSFTLLDKNGESVSLSDYLGTRVVVYFYPRDNTPGCTRQACAFAERSGDYSARGITVIGISRDSVASHLKFAEKYSLPFVLLSDPDRVAIEAFGVWREKKQYGKVSMGVLRSAFVISPDGVIEAVYEGIKPDTGADLILSELKG